MSERKELWSKKVGHISFYAYEDDGIETIVGELVFTAAQSFTLTEKAAMIGDIEALTRQHIIDRIDREIDAAVAQIHKDIHG